MYDVILEATEQGQTSIPSTMAPQTITRQYENVSLFDPNTKGLLGKWDYSQSIFTKIETLRFFASKIYKVTLKS